MTEDDAKAWIVDRFGGPALDRLEQFRSHVVAENKQQNLISPASVDHLWARHIADSAQLALLAPPTGRTWLDIGTGGGFPGIVVAMLRPEPVMLVEPRRKRAEFLVACVERLDLTNRVTVAASRAEKINTAAGTISARAVGSIADLLAATAQCSSSDTLWVLPRGQIVPEEIANLRETWQFMFHVEQSITNAGSLILILNEVRRR